METLSVNFLIKDSPAPVAILDTDMCFVSHSKIWLEKFAKGHKSIIGKSFYQIWPETPGELKKIHKQCLLGKSNSTKGKKIIYPDGRVQWLKWKINAWRDENDSVGGLIIIQEDITEEKRREELLIKAESVARIGGWEVDIATGKVYWTQVTKEIHEVPEDYVPNLEEGINFYKKGNSRDEITRLVSEAMANGSSWDTELQIVTAKGRELWVRAKGDTEIIDGKCTRIFGTFQDIDESKRTTLEYQKVSDRLAIAAGAANIGIWDYDVIENTLVWDQNMYRLYGIEQKHFKGVFEAWESVLHPEDKKRSNKEVELALTGKKDFDTEFRVIWPNGSIRHIKAMASVQRDSEGRSIKMIGANWDITELKTTELKLIRSQESFSGAFGESAVGMALVGLDGSWIEVNQSLCNSFGYSREELLNLTFQDLTFPPDLNRDLELLNEVVSGKRSSYQIDKRYYHKKGYLVHTLLTVTAVKDIDGNLSHFISQVVDITNRIEAEQRLKTLVDVTKGQNGTLMNFAHIVSHNLRSHSSNMSMLTNFLLKENNVNERQKIMAMLDKAVISLSETVQHLNEVVQIKTGALEKMRSVSLLNSVKSVEDNLGALLKEKDAICKLNISKSHFVNVVPAYLDSILLNLFTNSLKYFSPERRLVIKISSISKNNFIKVSFSDNGQGIDLERHGDKIFGMYKTFHKHKDAKGIGLFITKNQIESMYGTISVESKLGHGTTFILKFKKG